MTSCLSASGIEDENNVEELLRSVGRLDDRSWEAHIAHHTLYARARKVAAPKHSQARDTLCDLLVYPHRG